MSFQVIPRILLIVGALLVAAGCGLFFSGSPQAQVRRVESLRIVEPSAFLELPSGTAVLLEGSLVPREPLGPEGFVVYEKERYLRTETEGASKDKQQWLALSVPRALIGVERNGKAVPVCNRDYTMSNKPHRWQSDVLPTTRDLFDSTIRLSGFKTGDGLTVDGRVVGSLSTGTQCIEAKTVFGGGHQAYVEAIRHGLVVFKVVGGVFAALGAVMLAIGWTLRLRLSASA
jgi:hypothetical protein